jgi:HSP20 family protein
MPRNLLRFDPFAGLEALQRQFFEDGPLTPFRAGRMPTTDVYTEDDKRMVIESHLPGFAESDIEVNLDGDAVVLQAQRHEKAEDRNKKYVVRESSSSFYRRIALPEQADQSAVSATFKDGTLRIVVPFTASAAPKRVPISSDAGATA